MSTSLDSGSWFHNRRSLYLPLSLTSSEKPSLSHSRDRFSVVIPHPKHWTNGLRKLPAFKITLNECNESSEEEKNKPDKGPDNKHPGERSLSPERREIPTLWTWTASQSRKGPK